MLKSIWMWVLTHIFRIPTETKQKEVEDNLKYAVEYESINNINFNAIFSNKLANYTVSDSTLNIGGENPRSELLDMICQSLWKKAKKITSMSFGYGGVFLIPYVKGKKIFYNIVPQNRVTIDSMEGDLYTGITVLAERKEISKGVGQTKTYIRWSNLRLENGNCVIEQKFTDETGKEIPVPEFWKNIMVKITISNVDRVLAGYIKSPVNNRKSNDKYGVPITYGCESTINEIKETLKQLYDEFKIKKTFVGVDATLFKVDKNNGRVSDLPDNGLFKKLNATEDDFFEIFDPQFRSYTERLQELYKRLEHEVGTSYGILSEVATQNATATEIKHAMYDTFTICDDMRSAIEKGLEDFFYSCNVLANAYNLSYQGEYTLDFDWSYSLLEDTQAEWSQMLVAESKGIMSKLELRQWLKPEESIEESQKALDEIKEQEPKVDELLKDDEE